MFESRVLLKAIQAEETQPREIHGGGGITIPELQVKSLL